MGLFICIGFMEEGIVVLFLAIFSLIFGYMIGYKYLDSLSPLMFHTIPTDGSMKRSKRYSYLEPLNNRWLSQASHRSRFLQPVLPLKVQIRRQPARIIKIIAPG